jgi:hypothetical protein
MKVGDLVSHYNYGYGVVLRLGGGVRQVGGMVKVHFSDRIEEVWSEDLEPTAPGEFGVHYE